MAEGKRYMRAVISILPVVRRPTTSPNGMEQLGRLLELALTTRFIRLQCLTTVEILTSTLAVTSPSPE